MGYAADVVFDFEGSLNFAAELWRVADQLVELGEHRGALATTALDGWLGAYAESFVERKNGERQSAESLTELLRAEANAWAQQWKDAMDQDNNNRWARECDRIRDDRGALDKAFGAVFGHDDLPDRPRSADVPSAPSFVATRRTATF